MDYLKWLKEIMELEGWLRQREDDVFSTEYGNSFDELDKLMLKQVHLILLTSLNYLHVLFFVLIRRTPFQINFGYCSLKWKRLWAIRSPRLTGSSGSH